MKIEKNLETADKIVRLIFSTTFIILFLLGVIGGPMAAALLSLSAILLITVFFSFCPIYQALGINHKKNPPL